MWAWIIIGYFTIGMTVATLISVASGKKKEFFGGRLKLSLDYEVPDELKGMPGNIVNMAMMIALVLTWPVIFWPWTYKVVTTVEEKEEEKN